MTPKEKKKQVCRVEESSDEEQEEMTPKEKKKQVCRVEDSSDEEQEEMTPKEKKKQLMKDMIDRLNKVSNY